MQVPVNQKLNQDYELISVIGRGGFGEVFKCRECISGHIVAIKRLTTTNTAQQDCILDEIKTLSNLNFHSIIRYYHTFVEDGKLHLVMEYCEQGSLSEILRFGKIEQEIALKMMTSIMCAIEFVHSKGIIHHDIKPGNILIDSQKNIKIADFGVANTLGGTAPYMPPELLLNFNVSETDERTDIYSLGVTFIEMLTGRCPFTSHSQMIMAHKTKDYGIDELPYWLQEFLYKSINPNPEERYQSVSEMLLQFKHRNIPNIISDKLIEVGDAGNKILKELNKGNLRIDGLINYIENKFPTHPITLKAIGKFYFLKGQYDKAEEKFEQLFSKTQIISVHSDYARIFMQRKDFNRAINILSDQIQYKPDDLEAYSLIVECYYRSGRYDVGLELLKSLKKRFRKTNTLLFNEFLFKCAMYFESNELKKLEKEAKSNILKHYNYDVFAKGLNKYCTDKASLSKKSIYVDYIFDKHKNLNPFLLIKTSNKKLDFQNKLLIVIGRSTIPENDILLTGNTVSRRHCAILNVYNQVWIYDLGSTSGTYINGQRVTNRQLLYGKVDLVIGNHKLELITDNRLLF